MPTASRLRQAQRDEIHPLIRAIIERLGDARSYMELARDTGLANYQVGRILGEALPSPTYLDITKLVIAAGMTPNEAAHIVGLYNGPDYDQKHTATRNFTKEETRLIDLLRSVKLPEEERKMLQVMLETMLEAFAERLAARQKDWKVESMPFTAAFYDEEETPHWAQMEAKRRERRSEREKRQSNPQGT